MRTRAIRLLAALLVIAALLGALLVGAEDGAAPEIDFLSYEEALRYFDFDHAASNWCDKFGMNPLTQLEEARQAILAGTDRRLIIGLATFARDTGHAGEKLTINTAFRPACYQEALGLHDANYYTGPYRNNMTWNGRNAVTFWWNAERAQGWPEAYAIDLSGYDVETMDVGIFYRRALQLWDNSWISAYFAKPGCSSHNSGTAIDVSIYSWIGSTFDTSFTYNGRTYDMEDYGIYKPLQPSETSAGETWHITCDAPAVALGNYDGAYESGFEVVYGMYFNPALKGWNLDSGWGIYLGAGVACLQLRLCQLGLLEERYITGYYCSRTEAAVMAFQAAHGLEADGICGMGTMTLLMRPDERAADSRAPVLSAASVTDTTAGGFTLYVSASDDAALSAYRVETRREDGEASTVRYYNAYASGSGDLWVDIWQEGSYALTVSALDAAGNESPRRELAPVYVDATPPVLRCLRVSEITAEGFVLSVDARDDRAVALVRVELVSDSGQQREQATASDGRTDVTFGGLTDGVWTITVTAEDGCGNRSSYTLAWQYAAGTALPGRTITHYGQ